MRRIKIEKNKDYTVISNVFLRDKNLSLKAKGLLALIMSLPCDWDFSGQGIVSIVKEGESAIYSTIDELISFGYCKRERLTEKGRFAGYEYTFAEAPFVEKPFVENPKTDLPKMENREQLNKEESNKEESNKEERDLQASPTPTEQKILELEEKIRQLTEMLAGAGATDKRKKFEAPAMQEINLYLQAYFQEKKRSLAGFENESEKFYNYYASNGWRVGKNKMVDWRSAFRKWLANAQEYKITSNSTKNDTTPKYDPNDPFSIYTR